MPRYAVVELDDEGRPGREVARGSAVQVVLAAWEEVVPVELMQHLRLHELPAAQRRAAQRRAAERLREAAVVTG